MHRSLKLVRLMGMLWPTLETMLGIAIVLVLWLGGREVLQDRITVGGFVAFNTYMVQLTWPIIALGWVINIFQRGTASMARIDEILSGTPEIDDSHAVKAASGQPKYTRFGARSSSANLNFAYERRCRCCTTSI